MHLTAERVLSINNESSIDQVRYSEMFRQEESDEEGQDLRKAQTPNEPQDKKDEMMKKARLLIDKHKNNLEQMDDLKKRQEENNMYQDEKY